MDRLKGLMEILFGKHRSNAFVVVHVGYPFMARTAATPPPGARTAQEVEVRPMKLDVAGRRLTRERARLERILEGLLEEQNDGSEGTPFGELSLLDQHPADVGSETFERDKDLSILYNVQAELSEIDRALRRIQDGTYGHCEACGRPIGAARLEARPAARFCLEDQAGLERRARSA